jgi:hypothetical protein
MNLKYLKIKIMILLFIGIALVIFSVQFINRFYQLMPYKSIFNIIGVALIIFGIATSMVKQIGAGELGVQALFGKVDNRILVSGLNIINPLVEVKTFDAKTQNYTMSSVRDEGDHSCRIWRLHVLVSSRGKVGGGGSGLEVSGGVCASDRWTGMQLWSSCNAHETRVIR